MKLATAKKELASVLGNDCFPAVPPLPPHLGRDRDLDLDPFTTTTTTTAARSAPSPPPHASSDDDAPMLSPSRHPADPATASLPAKLVKKRKTAAAVPTATDADEETTHLPSPDTPPARRSSSHPLKHAGTRLKRTSSRLHRKVSRGSIRQHPDEQDEVVVVVRPGGDVPPVPVLPSGVEGSRVRVNEDDGYGGLGHEIF